jgi:hypothetical protein
MTPADEFREAIRNVEKKFFGDVVRETFQEAGKEMEDWSEHLNNVIDAIRSLKQMDWPEETDSMVVFRMATLFRELTWIQDAVIHGAYHSAIRDMRYLLESMVQAYWLWKKHPDAEMDRKHQLLPEFQRSKDLFKESGIPEQADLFQLFNTLSKFAHPTKQELEPVLVRGRIDSRIVFTFDRELFDKTRTLCNEAMDAILLIFFLRFHEARQPFLEAPHVKKGLVRLGQRKTLNLLQPQTGKEVSTLG